MKATAQTRRAAQLIAVIRYGQAVVYHCKRCGYEKKASVYYEADHNEMILHADRCVEMTKEEPSMSEERTTVWQFEELQKLVDPAFVKTAKQVKGSFTTGDYVTYQLNRILSPAKWSFTILDGPDMITLNEQNAYAQLIGRLEVTFADGSMAHQDDVGIWPLVATGARKGGTLNETAPERYETACKAARTDCLKNASYNLGTCFAPLSDGALVGFLRRDEVKNGMPELNESTSKSRADLFGIAKEREGDVAPATFQGVVAKYTNGLELPVWVEEIRATVGAHPQASDPVGGNGSFVKQLEISAGRKVPVEQFRAFIQIVLGHPLADITFGEASVLMDTINADDFEAKVIGLLS